MFEKYSNIKFHENAFSVTRVPYGETDEAMVASSNYAKAPNKAHRQGQV
jgi:hypothetical protein